MPFQAGYKLLILPDSILVDDKLAEKLTADVHRGGKALSSFRSGFDKNKKPLDFMGNTFLSDSGKNEANQQEIAGNMDGDNRYADYLICAGQRLEQGLSHTEYVMYIKGWEVKADPGSEVFAVANRSHFDRKTRHFCSHRQSLPPVNTVTTPW